ncbi:MAG: homogentisate 1,2-dioxygenase [Pseudonocardiales bacterium]|nr:MAG: homogentisate 1,2-dioxygenase [Pseudonocardiales bacterium]
MTHYQRVGDVPRKRHTMHRDGDGNRLAEELMGEEGFSAASSLLYHRHSPSAITAISPASITRSPLHPNEPLTPWHLRAPQLPPGGDLVTARHVLAATSTLTLCWVSAERTSPLYRDATGDELVYVQTGTGRLETSFGPLEVGPGDYLLVPAATTHRWVVEDGGVLEALVLEAAGHVGVPERYLTSTGQLREGAPFCERDLRVPAEPLLVEATDVEVLVRSRAGWSWHTHAHHPFDVVGWDGCLYPYAFNIADFEPITGRIHQPPPAHQVFAGTGFVICNFVPRKVDYHPLAVPVPYYHSNVDSDEVMFYCGGDYEARKGSGIGPGSISLHPGGHSHGPQPGAVERSLGAESFDELAVMVDTFRPLELGEGGAACEDPAYPWSWSGRGPTR